MRVICVDDKGYRSLELDRVYDVLNLGNAYDCSHITRRGNKSCDHCKYSSVVLKDFRESFLLSCRFIFLED